MGNLFEYLADQEKARELAIKKHRDFWNTYATEIRLEKIIGSKLRIADKYPEFEDIRTCINKCYLCEYSSKVRFVDANEDFCTYCPLYDIHNHLDKGCLNGLYYRFTSSDTWEEAAEFATEIANLPIVNEMK